MTKIKFYGKYKKFAASQVMWSLTWQAAVFYDKNTFCYFAKKNNVITHAKKLLRYRKTHVVASSFLLIISPKLFRVIVRLFKHGRYI